MDRLTLRHRHREAPQLVSPRRRVEMPTIRTPSWHGGWTSDIERQASRARRPQTTLEETEDLNASPKHLIPEHQRQLAAKETR